MTVQWTLEVGMAKAVAELEYIGCTAVLQAPS
jgi:hypothetical protein